MKRYIGILFTTVAIAAAIFLVSVILQDSGAINAFSYNSSARGSWKANEAGETLLVNDTHPLPDGYEPASLVNLYEQKRYFLLASSDLYLEETTFEAANALFKKAEDEGINGFIITSAYRTWEKQQEVYQSSEDETAALPGCSEHQTGMAFDVTTKRDSGDFEDTEQFKWLIRNCWDYGFILRYPEGAESITGMKYESWHYRYVGVDIAQYIRDHGLTLEEYCLGTAG